MPSAGVIKNTNIAPRIMNPVLPGSNMIAPFFRRAH